MSSDDSSVPAPGSAEADVDVTSTVPIATVRLSDFVAGEPPLPLAFLLVVAGEERGRNLVVEDLPAVVGRAADADLVIDDDTVSRHHARLSGDRDTLFLEDLGSSNGTTLNGNPMVGAVALHDGDLVGFGESVVVVKVVS